MTSQPWFRFYSEALDDLKLSRAAHQTGQAKVIILGIWVGLLALANGSPKRNQLLLCDDVPLNLLEMGQKIGVDGIILEDVIAAFESLNMVHWYECKGGKALVITNMHKRQFSSDVSTPRVQKHREQKKQGETSEPKEGETLQERSCNLPDTDTDTEQITDSETDLTPSANADASILTPPEPKSPPPEPKKPPSQAPVREDQAMFSALASLCYGGMSVMNKKMRGKLNSTGKTLRDGGAKSTDCSEFSRWWYACDWRGQRHQKPTPELVVEKWGTFIEWRKDGSKISGPTNRRSSTILAASAARDGNHNTPSPEQLAADKRAIADLRKRQQARAGAG